MTQVAVIINSFDGFSDCWPGLIHGLNKYWPDCPYPIHLVSNFKDCEGGDVSTLKVGDLVSWSERLLAALSRVHTPYILFLQEDYWLTSPVDTERVQDYVRLMERDNLSYIRLLAIPPPSRGSASDPRLGIIARDGAYRTSSQIALWRREVLSELLVPGESVWQFELEGTPRSRRYGDTFLSVKAHGDDPYYWGMYYLCTAVNGGRWSRAAKRYAETEGVAMDFSQRRSETWWDDFKRSRRIGAAARISQHRAELLARNPTAFLRKTQQRLTDPVRYLLRAIRTYGSRVVSLRAAFGALRRYPSYVRARRAFQSMDHAARLRVADDLPVLDEATATTQFDPHYTYLDGWAASRVAAARPREHVDVASRLSFAVGLSAFVPVTFIDRRPVQIDLDGFHPLAGDLLELPYSDRSVASLSCLHVIEHVGLGRYGDPLDPLGTLHAARELQRVLAPNGMLLLGLPVGRRRVRFNAHRVHDPLDVLAMFPELRLVGFAAVDDAGRFTPAADPADFAQAEYACGCYEFTRPVG